MRSVSAPGATPAMGGFNVLLLLTLLVGSAGAAEAQERPVRWSLTTQTDDGVSPGDTVRLRLGARIEDRWYLYSLTQPPGGPIQTRIELAPESPVQIAGVIDAPDPDEYPDRNFNIFSEVYQDSVAFEIAVVVRTVARSGSGPAVLVRYQTCNDRYCLPPRTDTLTLSLQITGAADGEAGDLPAIAATAGDPESDRTLDEAPAPAPSVEVSRPIEGRIIDPGSRAGPPQAMVATSAIPFLPDTGSLTSFLWLAALMGLLSLLTPCVFPMIPVTVGFFAPKPGQRSATGPSGALSYAGGMIFAFGAIGVGITLLFGASGIVQLAANPWLNLAVAAGLIAFSLNLLGVYQIRLPAGLLARLNAAGSRARGRGTAAFLMGVTFAIASFTCTAPLVGALLVLTTQGAWQWPLLGVLVYAAAFALPFFLLALAPGALSRLPRSGAWMVTLKGAIGLLELAAALKFLSNVDLVWQWGILSREVNILLWIGITLALALLLAGFFPPSARIPARRIGPVRALLTGSAALAALWLGGGLRGGRLGELEAFLPPRQGGDRLVVHGLEAGELPWRRNDYEGSLAAAYRERQPLLVDFTGYTCTNCRWMEANMFPREEIRPLLERYVRVRLFTDGEGEVYARQQAFQQREFGTVALPLYAIVSPSGQTVATFLGMTRDSKEFVRFLEAGIPGLSSDATR